MTHQELTTEIEKREKRFEIAKRSGTLPEELLSKETEKIEKLKTELANIKPEKPVKKETPKKKEPEVKVELPVKTSEEIEADYIQEKEFLKSKVKKIKAYQSKVIQ